MIRAYVAGPFRGPDHWVIAQNIHRAREVALELWALGLSTYCPHGNTSHYQGALPDEVWLEGHLEWLRVSDVMVVLPNPFTSSGTLIEIEFALAKGIPCFQSERGRGVAKSLRIRSIVFEDGAPLISLDLETLEVWLRERK
jgi:nucleoside 2-deoxyribosyltransferase